MVNALLLSVDIPKRGKQKKERGRKSISSLPTPEPPGMPVAS
jgi:hypothetical protein